MTAQRPADAAAADAAATREAPVEHPVAASLSPLGTRPMGTRPMTSPVPSMSCSVRRLSRLSVRDARRRVVVVRTVARGRCVVQTLRRRVWRRCERAQRRRVHAGVSGGGDGGCGAPLAGGGGGDGGDEEGNASGVPSKYDPSSASADG